ncbi:MULTISPECIES: STAS domain-containing protein [unclassified Aureimonas]|jgi:anti-anti-sigma regulatory factor|uniref:STAS domain-containing protein n=1 Tax=unclassified Aureimonas TaxID=2615206 RepID=UPI0006F549AD|nr:MULTISPECIES: STAS domain-containing protein [unclassified Aureimonas]KQT69012.1 hypothetical protein ASG54_04965 [Aureimonas sp. Leaf460]KQT69242.1 hypothetical protein ASG62_17570 [Aureimonas sp. Leaf427]
MTIDDEPLRAPSHCTIVEADTFRQALLARLSGEGAGPVEIDLSGVEDADITLIQLVLAAGKSAEAKGRSLSVTSSPAVADLLSRAGLSGWPMPSGTGTFSSIAGV